MHQESAEANDAGMADTTASTAGSARVVGRPWQPGESGNRAGRPPAKFDLAGLCRERAPGVVAMLVESLGSASWRERHSAAAMLLDRGFGRAVQPIAADEGAGQLSMLHLIAARRVGQALQEMVEKQRHNGADPSEPLTIDFSVPALE